MWVVGDSLKIFLPPALDILINSFFLGFFTSPKNFIYLCQNKDTQLLLLLLVLLSLNNDYLSTIKLAPIIPHHPPLCRACFSPKQIWVSSSRLSRNTLSSRGEHRYHTVSRWETTEQQHMIAQFFHDGSLWRPLQVSTNFLFYCL